MLTFNLKKQWFDKIKSGEKTHEYREVKPYWTKRLFKDNDYDINESGFIAIRDWKHLEYILLVVIHLWALKIVINGYMQELLG